MTQDERDELEAWKALAIARGDMREADLCGGQEDAAVEKARAASIRCFEVRRILRRLGIDHETGKRIEREAT